MLKVMKTGIMGLAICIICFCLSFVIAVTYVIKPRHQYMTDQGIYNDIKELKTIVMEKEQQILQLEEQIEIYESILNEEAQNP